MRKKKRFTPKLIRKWRKNGRGEGTGQNYRPFHQVTRSDPGSRGRSHYIAGTASSRKHHLLSDGEQLALIFLQQLPGYSDCLEQFPLEHRFHEPFLTRYGAESSSTFLPGTVDIAKELSIRHPMIHGDGESDYWQMTTDLVGVLRDRQGRRDAIAISVKEDLPLSKRDAEKLKIESAYWRQEGFRWLLFVKKKIPRALALNVRALATWTSKPFPIEEKIFNHVCELFDNEYSLFLIECLILIQEEIGVELEGAQTIFWKAVWSGRIPLDLNRDLFRGAPLLRVSSSTFRKFNPIWSGESAWPA